MGMNKGYFRKQSSPLVLNHGDWIGVDASTKSNPNSIALIDVVDYEHILSLGVGKFTAVSIGNRTCVVVSMGRLSIPVHRLIYPKSKCIDHINHNCLDNRRDNLRVCTKQQNSMNRLVRVDSVTGVTGVHFEKSRGCYKASIGVNGKCINLGRFKLKEDAVLARISAEKKYFGEYACTVQALH